MRPLCPAPVLSPVRALDHMLVAPEVPALQHRLLALVDLPLHIDVRQTFTGNFPIALTDVKVGNLPIALTDVSPGNFPLTYTDDTLGTLHSMLPDVSLRRPGQAHYDVLHPQVQDLQNYPRGREEVGMKTSFSVSECFSGLVTRESWKTTCPALKPGMMGCPSAAYRAKLKLYIRLQDFRSDWAQNWFLADVLTKIQTSDRSKPTFSVDSHI